MTIKKIVLNENYLEAQVFTCSINDIWIDMAFFFYPNFFSIGWAYFKYDNNLELEEWSKIKEWEELDNIDTSFITLPYDKMPTLIGKEITDFKLINGERFSKYWKEEQEPATKTTPRTKTTSN